MKGFYKILLIFICIISVLAIIVSATDDSGFNRAAGTLLGDYLHDRESISRGTVPSNAIASYHGVVITTSEVDYQRKLAQLSSTVTESDIQIADRIIQGLMIKDEAERLGLNATEQEITVFIASVRESYTYPDGKEMIDEYCESAGITAEEYYDIIEDSAPAIISKQKLRDEIGRQYCQEHGLEFTKINPPQEMMDAIDAYIEELFQAHKDEIVYYIDIDE